MVEHSSSAAVGQVLGYARVSSADQNPDRQTAALAEAGCHRIFTDTTSGARRDERPALAALLDYARHGDRVVVPSMDRLARSLRDLLDIVDELTRAGVSVVFLSEGQTYYPAERADPTSRMMMSVLGAIAEFERALIHERQAAGIAAAKKRGAYKGRHRALSPSQIEDARARIAAGVPKAAIARDLGVSRSTLYRTLADKA